MMFNDLTLNNSIEDWSISLLIIVGALLVNKLIVVLHRKVIKRLVAKNHSYIDDILFESLEKPVLLGVLLLAIWIATNRLQLGYEAHEIISKSYDVLVVLNITWFFVRFASAFIENATLKSSKSQKRYKIDPKLLPVIKRTALIIIWFIGIVTALNNVGIEATTLLGTLGIGGIAFALAAQDTIKNIFGGFTIYMDKTFRIGDTIKFDSVEGTVVDIGLRSTRIRNYDRRLLTVPNYKLTDAFITNISSEPDRRIVTALSLAYHTSPEQMQKAMQILRDIPNRIADVKDNDLVVSFTDYTDSAMTITFIYFIRKPADIYETRSKVNLEILQSFSQAGVKFAFPSRMIYIESTHSH